MMRVLRQFLAHPARAGALLAAFAVSPLTAAAAPVTVDASGLGAVDAAIRFCIGVDPRDTRQFRQLEKTLVGNLSDRRLDAMRETAQYRQTYSLLSTVLSGAPHDWAATSCTNVIATSNSRNSASEHEGQNGEHAQGSDKNHHKDHD